MKIAAFNAQRFGLAKVSDPDVLSILIKIVSRYDIIVILEVVDVSGASITQLLAELNRVNTSHHYALQLSTRLGRTRYKEQFMFLYRDDVVDLIDSYQYEDNQVNDTDVFLREPYILFFKPRNTVLKNLVLIPVHAASQDSKRELDELYEVFLVVRDKWKTDNVMILGDFRADGVIVVFGEEMLKAIVPKSAKPFNFPEEFSLTEEMALRVSDHYPVEVEFTSTSPFWIRKTKKRHRSVESQPVQRVVTGKDNNCNLLCLVTGRYGM
ncbi:unnamed protein product [Menidia menidia]|uniref:Deoxyribonuclease n=1 Tax=Menidia menidia TaxID=238744 RepID=A0A8S4BTN8_9TELE|nr:unnamed protein product [Menidia menidia]